LDARLGYVGPLLLGDDGVVAELLQLLELDGLRRRPGLRLSDDAQVFAS
jgi:hypothetical protein